MPIEKHLVFNGTIEVCTDEKRIWIDVIDNHADIAIRECLEKAVMETVTSTIVSTAILVH